MSVTVAITGAAGNLGSLLAQHLAGACPLRLMYHRTPLADGLARLSTVTEVRADLADPASLGGFCGAGDVVVHFAGVLFAPRPARFLPETNTRYFDNLLNAALQARAGKVILISFPHVEGPTSVERPATGRLDCQPVSVHARTRLQEERLLIDRTAGTGTVPVVLRLGMVYGRGILMVDAARWLAERRLLGVWREPTWIQLVSATDYLRATEAAIFNDAARGVYHVGDEQPVTLQHFLDEACRAWGCGRPWRLPVWTIYAAASLCEAWATIARTRSPLTRDFVRIGRVPYWGDTTRARRDLIPDLRHPTLASGLATL